MANIIDDSLSGLQAIDPEHILDLSEVGEEEIDTLSEAIREVIVGVSSVNGMTGDVVLDIPEKTSDLINDSGFITENDVPVKSVNGQTGNVTINVPTKTSQLTNDSGFITNSELSGYATKQDIQVTVGGDTFDTSQEFADFLVPAIGDAFVDIYNSIGGIQELIPNQASISNQLADKNFVNSSVQTATANFRGNWTDWADVPTVATDYPVDYAGNKTPTVNDYLVVQDASDYTLETLEGTWRFKYTGTWATDGKAGWHPEYQVNETPLTAAQLAALNSGITAGLVANIPTAPNIVITLGVDGGGNMVWSGADSISDVRNAFSNGGSVRVEAPLLTGEVYNVTEVWWKDSNQDTLVMQSVDNDAALIQIGIADDYSVEMDNVNLQERLQAGANISINGNVISASASTITVDTEINNTSTNPVQNKALYDAIVGKKITFAVPANSWSEPSGTNPYTTIAIVTLPAGSFTSNCTIELTIEDKFNDFARYGFVLYSAEAASQRIWLTAMKKPSSQVYLTVKVYTYGN